MAAGGNAPLWDILAKVAPADVRDQLDPIALSRLDTRQLADFARAFPQRPKPIVRPVAPIRV